MTNLYNAGLMGSSFHINGGRVFSLLDENEKKMRLSNTHFLESYHYIDKESLVERIRSEGIKVFLDSGAFTAFTKGVKIDLGRYIDYCHRNADIIEMISVLDEINFADVKNAVKVTYRNLMEMERRGLKGVIPTYHFGEDPEVLKHYAQNYPYISLGGLVGAHPKQLIVWLDRVWGQYLINADGTPKVKVHGFGLTSLPIVERYPWYSVDSSTWVQWAQYGMILLPWRGEQLNVSSRSSSIKVKDNHLRSICEISRATVEHEIISRGGNPQRLAEFYYSRWAWNVWAFYDYVTTHSTDRFTPEFTGLFDAFN